MQFQCLELPFSSINQSLANRMKLFKRPRLIASKLLITCLLAGCNSNMVGTEPSEPAEQAKSPKQEESIYENTKESPPNNAPERDESGHEDHAIATEPYHIDGIKVSLLEVKRASGDTLNVYWRMKNKSPETHKLVSCSASWYCPYQLAAGNFGDGIYIIDSVNQRKHLVVKADKKPVVSTFKTPLSITPGSSINLWAKFPAPPPDVQSVSIYIPGVAPMEDIPISE